MTVDDSFLSGRSDSSLSCLSVINRTRCLADFLSCFSEGKRYLFNHFSSSHGNSRSKRTNPMSCRFPRHVTWSKSSVILFFDYFEQVTRRSIRLMFSWFQRKNIFTFFSSIGNNFRKENGRPIATVCESQLQCPTSRCSKVYLTNY